MQVSDADKRLLRQLLATPEAALGDLAARAGLTAATAGRRLEKLRAGGIIKGQSRELDWAALGYSVQVSLRITLDKTARNAFDAFIAAAREVPEVLEIQTFLGRVDVRLAVIARDMAHYQEIYRDKILTLPHIAEIEALMHVARIKSEEALPI